MGKALYRKYRSKSFDEVVGQEHITKTLQAAIKSGRISHAYLFTGPRGVGKTSVARILAHEVNSIPYNGEETHLDIIEIDAASNRRIDEIRDLREKVHIAPTSAKFKVYIIDEVHMLTREAFNALLKTLEEPPAHCIFILATTEAHKLPETIVSRTQRHSFKTVNQATAVKYLADIAKREKITIDKEALELLAEFGEGSFRDSISLLDQLSSSGAKVDANLVRLQLGLKETEKTKRLLEHASKGHVVELLDLLTELRAEGNDAVSLAKVLSKELRNQIKQNGLSSADTNLLKSLSQISGGASQMDKLEIALLEAASLNSAGLEAVTAPSDSGPKEQKFDKTEKIKEVPKTAEATSGSNFDLTMWEEVLKQVKQKNASIYTALRLASPLLDGTTLTLVFEFPLHQKKLNQAQARDEIASAIESVSGDKVMVNSIVDKENARKLRSLPETDFYNKEDDDNSENSLQAISNIFGSAEVLES
ncbi:DNA polymerase III subunit gamma/tau [Candidatus Saccharibacteria bacterium]|nr:DNA polymerase III subunit gamma/tau [Candidatus Saccharibacteria bacterium]